MLLPGLELFTKWAGHRSVGALLLDRKAHDREANAAEHKILKELLSGKRISIPRVSKLFDAVLKKRQLTGKHMGEGLAHSFLEWTQSDTPWIQLDSKEQQNRLFWIALGQHLPEDYVNTDRKLELLDRMSQELLKRNQNEGCHSVAQVLSDLAASPAACPAENRFLDEIADLFTTGKEEIARAELAAFGTLVLAATFLAEGDTSTASLRDRLTNLFSVEDNQVNPVMSFSRWLVRLEQRTGYTKDKLLQDGFVLPYAEAEKLAEQDPRNYLRNARRYRSGEQVPSYSKAKECLHALRPEMQPDEIARWDSELEHRDFGVFFVLIVTNSARWIKKVGGVPERPCQAVFDLFLQEAS